MSIVQLQAAFTARCYARAVVLACVRLSVCVCHKSVSEFFDNLFCVRSLLVREVDVAAYIWLHKNCCIYELPWNSPWTWLLSMIGVDFCYYWFHRNSHGLQADCFGFYRAMLHDATRCIRGTSHGPVSVCVCPSVCHKSVFY